ncbi:MAG: phosphate regulon sensor histidine kinase PhoR [Halioglobus sp.]|nr:phosphate regulon sensor histidine kinase PhoR [Halioglobus sp.]
MTWVAVTSRALLLITVVAFVGALYGYPQEAVILVLLGICGFSYHQMRRVQLWLRTPEKMPPDAFGPWGEVLSRMYFLQRNSQEAQAQLQVTVDYLQDSFAAMRDGVVMVDTNGCIKWLNRSLEPLLGLHCPEDTGQMLTNLVRAPEFNRYFLAMDYSAPLQYLASAGDNPLYLRVEITPFGEGERILFVRDVTKAVLMEKMRREFVANVSHELRTPLTVISGYLGSILTDTKAFPEHYLKALKQMGQQAERMENLLNDLLWLSRIESEQHISVHESIDVRGLFNELRDDLVESHPNSILVLNIATDKTIFGDYRQLYSAVSNLVINAIKYSPEGTPVTLSWILQGHKLCLQVSDHGLGIDASHIPRLTERFYRVDDSRSSATGGTGLGLAIVKHVAAANHGQLNIESILGEGSTFTLVFRARG